MKIKTFETDIKLQNKFLNAVEKLFEPINIERKEIKDFWVMDEANACLIEAKSDLMKELLKPFFNPEGMGRNQLNIDYDKLIGHTARYNSDYIKKITDIFSVFDSVKISVAKDYPITFENEHLRVILAPKAEG